jgi:hypothetical protein
MSSKLEWHGDAFKKHLARATKTGLKRAGVFYHSKCREVVSRPNTGVRVRGKSGKTYTTYPSPSKPGEAPKLRTGFGRNNIVINFDPNGMWVRVGVTTNGMYMFWLEVGTRRIARRPWLLKTLVENQEMIGKLAATGD